MPFQPDHGQEPVGHRQFPLRRRIRLGRRLPEPRRARRIAAADGRGAGRPRARRVRAGGRPPPGHESDGDVLTRP
ncbi:hypothetical protein G6F50_018409 [Rhizopus delemar]|uniref:Uncharacterized protein n=1 Tax=Rhizopus delemar TaxID=936053 RepID=A0A9P6XMA0_9FUNG|nr:hypothetical protein G6F50_018409 [Rhizopus delemar]